MECKWHYDQVAAAVLLLFHAMWEGFPAGSTGREHPLEEARAMWNGRDEGCNCQLNTLSQSYILAQLIITFHSFSVHLQAVIIRAV